MICDNIITLPVLACHIWWNALNWHSVAALIMKLWMVGEWESDCNDSRGSVGRALLHNNCLKSFNKLIWTHAVNHELWRTKCTRIHTSPLLYFQELVNLFFRGRRIVILQKGKCMLFPLSCPIDHMTAPCLLLLPPDWLLTFFCEGGIVRFVWERVCARAWMLVAQRVVTDFITSSTHAALWVPWDTHTHTHSPPCLPCSL